MRYFLICDSHDTYTGLRMAGIEGVITADAADCSRYIEQAAADENIAILIITETLADKCRGQIDDLKLSALRPLVVEIPGRQGSIRPGDAITRNIREAIGIKL